MTRYAIIGIGVAGFSAAQALRSLDPASDVKLVSDDPHGYYSRPGLAYYLSGEIPEKQLFPFSKKGKLSLDVEHIKAHVTSINPKLHSIETDSAGSISYDRLLIATGAHSMPINIPGADLQGVVTLDSLEDTQKILALARHARTAVVVGGGVLAIELAEGLMMQGVKVHYLLRGDWYWSNTLAEPESRLIEKHLTQGGIALHHHAEIEEILGKKGKVIGVRTTSGEVIRCKMVAVGIGVKACLDLALSAELKTDRGILANEYLQTSDPDIYAAGDVVQIFDPRTGRSSIDNLWYPGRKQGRIAALNMAGDKQVYQRSIATNVVYLAGVITTIMGSIGSGRDEGPIYTTRGSSETWQRLPNTIAAEGGHELNQLRLILGERTLLGALIMGEQKLARPVRELISNQADITPIRHQLLQPGAQLGTVVMDYWMKVRQ